MTDFEGGRCRIAEPARRRRTVAAAAAAATAAASPEECNKEDGERESDDSKMRHDYPRP